jgi:hypothetical protein
VILDAQDPDDEVSLQEEDENNLSPDFSLRVSN